MTELIPTLTIVLLALMVFALCYMLAVRDDRIEQLQAHDTWLRERLHDAYAERDEGWRMFYNADERVSALLLENTRALVELAYLKRGKEWQQLDASELADEVEEWLLSQEQS